MQRMIEKVLKEIGVTINGNKPYDVQVHDPRFYSKLIYEQSIGAGESYMDGMWDCDRLDELFFKVCHYRCYSKFYSPLKLKLQEFKSSFINEQSRQKADDVAQLHYNLDSKIFEIMLGKSLAYTCGYWKDAQTLDEAQFAKYELICQKLELKPGEKVLEMACGLGGLAKYMAEKKGVEVTAFDIGSGPASYATKLCQDLPITVYQCDYRDINTYNPQGKKFDKVVSVGALEHIGYKNYDTFLSIAHSFMKEDGIFLLHSIGGNDSRKFCDAWIDKYIFPHGMLPSLKQLGAAFENKFVVEDLHNFGAYYDKTLLSWAKNLNDNWHELKNRYDERFHRMMNYYLLSCAGAFRAREMQLFQFVLTPRGKLHGYHSIR